MEEWIQDQIVLAKHLDDTPLNEYKYLQLDQCGNDTYGSLIVKYNGFYDKLVEQRQQCWEWFYRSGEEDTFWKDQANELQKQIDDYKLFGHPGVNYRHYEYLRTFKDYLDERFFNKYSRERIVYSSPEEFTNRIQDRFDDLAIPLEQQLRRNELLEELIKELREKKNFGDTMMSTYGNAGESSDKTKDLPDEGWNTNYAHLQNTGTRSDEGWRQSVDNTIKTKLTNILASSSVDLNSLTYYLNSFGHLFMTLVI